MSNTPSQESEFEARRRHAQQSADLINALKERVSQLVERYYQHTSASSKNSVKLLDMLLQEVQELAKMAVASVQQDLTERGQSLLPALRNDPYQLLLSAIEELSTADLEDYVHDHFSAEQYETIHEVYKVIRRAIKNLCEQARLSADEVVHRFNALKEQYTLDHEQQLLYYREECDSHHDNQRDNQHNDRQCLNDRYHDNKAVQIWLRCDMDICRTIDEMTRLGYEEKELTDLFAYIVRAEILHEIANEARQLVTGQPSQVPSDEKVTSALKEVLPLLNSTRQWYCIYKPLVQVGKIVKGDFKGFEMLITRLLGKLPYPINTRDLCSKMDVGSFKTCDVSKWNEEDTPVTGRNFISYQSIALTFLEKLTE